MDKKSGGITWQDVEAHYIHQERGLVEQEGTGDS